MVKEELIPRHILMDILRHRCNIIANPQTGKTNLAKVILSEFVRTKLPIQIKIMDTASVWRYGFLSSFKFQEINKSTRKVYDGKDNVLFDLEFNDNEEIMRFMGNDVLLNYELNRHRKKVVDGKLNDWVLYCIEEAQSSLGRYALSRQTGRIWLKMISEGANFGLGFLFIGQRAQDISASIIERSTCSFIGRTTGDNNTRKLRGLIGKEAGKDKLGSPIHEKAKSLEVGEFIFWSGKEAWVFDCPLFDELYPEQKPQLVVPQRKRWLRLW